MKFRKSVLVLTAGLFAALLAVFALGVSKAASAPLNNEQLQLLFSNSNGRATLKDCWETGMLYRGRGDWDFDFKEDGSFTLHFLCDNAYEDYQFDSSGRWRIENNKLCIVEDGDLFSRFGIKSPDKCFGVNSERVFFEARDSSNRTIWSFRIFSPNLPFEYSDQLTELKKLFRESPQTGEPLNTKEAKAREAEIARLRQKIEKAEKSRLAEVARLKQEAEEARKGAGVPLAAIGDLTLGPAEYKPLPVGTKVRYDNLSYTVQRTDGFETIVKEGKQGKWPKIYAGFGWQGDDYYTLRVTNAWDSFIWTTEFDDQNKKALEKLWPLKVGNKTTLSFGEEFAGMYGGKATRTWNMTVEVLDTENLRPRNLVYPTFVVQVHVSSEAPVLPLYDFPEQEYTETYWYNPGSGLPLKFVRNWIRGGEADSNDQYLLEKVTYPKGTTTHALKGTKPSALMAAAPDKALLAEVEKLKQQAEQSRQAEAVRKARQAEAEKARQAEIARLKQEAGEARRAVATRKAREGEEDKARQSEIARLKKEIEAQSRAKAQLTERESRELKEREAEVARLRKEVRDRRQAESARKAREAGEEKTRMAEMARLKQEAEESRRAETARKAREAEEDKARTVEMARLKQEAEKAKQTRLAEIAQLKQQAEEAEKARQIEIASLRRELEKARQAREAEAENSDEGFEGIQFGNYHALVIGINDYQYLPKLTTAVNDAKAVAKLLQDEYGFKVTTLINADHGDIIDALDEYVETLGPDDNLLIYYAGHGWLNEELDRGYWLPANAKPKRRSRWVSNATLTDTLKGLAAKHVMVVADSCYSGTLVRSADVGQRNRTGDYWKRMAAKWARVAITSGGLEPVADKGGGGHSPFAKAFLDALKGNNAIMDGTQLFSRMRRPVMLATEQTPQYSDVRNAGHDGGDFIFVRTK